jgi:hypothetical protein
VCLNCDEFITAEIELAHLLPLLSVGVLLVNDVVAAGPGGEGPVEPGGSSPALRGRQPEGPPLTTDDLAALRELLDADDWPEHLAENGGGT